ncbi:MAG TPA: tetratricopeptide repeat protein [Terracidiphilus sp.]|nr:tetratricopeptide repeat protein [Terracidiphilus sp.]
MNSGQWSVNSYGVVLRKLVLTAALAGALGQAWPQDAVQMDDAQRWSATVAELGQRATRTADEQLRYATALARLGRRDEAVRAFEAGRRMAPGDARFDVELAGLEFQQKRYARAAVLLRAALRLEPNDTYANDFLATVYFLEGSTEAALKYWNRVGKPRVGAVRVEPEPRVDASLLDRQFAFAPATTMTREQYLDTQTRVAAMGIFPRPQFDLRARDAGDFDVAMRAVERNGLGDSKLEVLVGLLHAAPFEAVTVDAYNLRHRAINFTSMVRWDANKRRLEAELSGQLDARARFRYEVGLDLRNENWAVRDGFTGNAPVLASLNVRREAGSVAVRSDWSDRLQWRVGGEVSARDYRSVQAGAVLTPELLESGVELKQAAEVRGALLRVPERRFVLAGTAREEAARVWSTPQRSYARLHGELAVQWMPRAEGDDYAVEDHLRAGRTFGAVPFDELWMLGLERDNDLPLRAHIGTRDGKKGAAPLGRHYVANTWELDKNVWGNGLMAVAFGPFADAGAMADDNTALGSHKWLADVGGQVKLRVFSTRVAFSYGKDLRTGNNALYVTLLP